MNALARRAEGESQNDASRKSALLRSQPSDFSDVTLDMRGMPPFNRRMKAGWPTADRRCSMRSFPLRRRVHIVKSTA